jgi:hypothetical protein
MCDVMLCYVLTCYCYAFTGEHQYELLDFVAAKFYEEPGVFKLLVNTAFFFH